MVKLAREGLLPTGLPHLGLGLVGVAGTVQEKAKNQGFILTSISG